MVGPNICPICNFVLQWNEKIQYRCGHAFHKKCTANKKCPICFKKFVLEEPRCLSDASQNFQRNSETILKFIRQTYAY